MEDLPTPVRKGVEALAEETSGNREIRLRFSPIGGGCINHGGKLSGSGQAFFVKWNLADRFPHMFHSESRGLALLAAPGVMRIPQVVGVGEAGAYQFILMEFIENSRRVSGYWNLLGERLAGIHKATHGRYGLDHPNYMGSLTQYNCEHDSWTEFFIVERLEVQVKMSIDQGSADAALAARFGKLYQSLPSILHEEPPSLLHGDLWGGNLITDEKGEPCLIDPAVYYGHREVDLAMTQLFGGFEPAFYHGYNEAFPLESGYEDRLDIYNLYPLLVHVNLFGQSYLHQVRSILSRFT